MHGRPVAMGERHVATVPGQHVGGPYPAGRLHPHHQRAHAQPAHRHVQVDSHCGARQLGVME